MFPHDILDYVLSCGFQQLSFPLKQLFFCKLLLLESVWWNRTPVLPVQPALYLSSLEDDRFIKIHFLGTWKVHHHWIALLLWALMIVLFLLNQCMPCLTTIVRYWASLLVYFSAWPRYSYLPGVYCELFWVPFLSLIIVSLSLLVMCDLVIKSRHPKLLLSLLWYAIRYPINLFLYFYTTTSGLVKWWIIMLFLNLFLLRLQYGLTFIKWRLFYLGKLNAKISFHLFNLGIFFRLLLVWFSWRLLLLIGWG